VRGLYFGTGVLELLLILDKYTRIYKYPHQTKKYYYTHTTQNGTKLKGADICIYTYIYINKYNGIMEDRSSNPKPGN
jgi:hypothetical protein